MRPQPDLSNAPFSRPRTSSREFPVAVPSEYETLPGLLKVLRRRWRAALLTATVVAVLGGAVLLSLTRRYAATATLEVDQEKQVLGPSSEAPTTSDNVDMLKSEVDTDIGILRSPGLALSVIKELGLEKVPPFWVAAEPAERGRSLDDAPLTRDKMTRLFAKRLKVESPESTRLINVTFEGEDPVKAAVIANTLAQTFIDKNLELHHRAITNSSYWLQRELDDLKTQVEASEQRLADYERKTGMAGVQVTGGSTNDGASSVSVSPHNTVMERLFALNQELTTAEANRISAEMVYHLVQSQDPEVVLGLGAMNIANANGGSGGTLTTDSGIELVRSLRAQQTALARQYASASVTYGSNSSRLTQLQQQIDAVDQQQRAELERVKVRAENAYLYAKRNEDSIRQQFTGQQSAADVLADNTVRLQILGQEAYSNRALYESLFSKLQTANLTSGVRTARIDIVDAARPAGSPSSPDLPKYLALVMGFAVFCGISLAFLLESLDDSVRTPSHLAETLGVTLLGYVPKGSGRESFDGRTSDSQLIDAPYSTFSESFRTIRTNLLLALAGAQAKSLLITSAVSGDGKTTVAFNLGVALAQQGGRVLLVDGDLRHPDLHRHFGVAASPGLSDLLNAPEALERDTYIVRHAKLPTLSLLPSGNSVILPTEMLGRAAFDDFLRRSKHLYDYVLVDSPPILAIADASVIANRVGGILAVVRSRVTTRSACSALVQSLELIPTPTLGVILNNVRQPILDEFPVYSYVPESKEGTLYA